MEIDISPDETSALMSRLPPEFRRQDAGFTFVDGVLHVPELAAGAVVAVMETPGWRDQLVAPEVSPVEKLAAFLSANPDVAALIGSS
jgi:hypothetical protein